jgi:hypothetical protein
MNDIRWMDFLPVILYPMLALAGLVLIAVTTGHFLADMGGWRVLASAYRSPSGVLGHVISRQSAEFRAASYIGVLQLTTNSLGCRFELISPFHFGHPPFFVPWVEMIGILEKRTLRRLVVLKFARVPSVTMTISEKLAKRMRTESNENWTFEGS